MCGIAMCAGEAVCCAGAACCGCLCKLCGCCGVSNKTYSKIGFVFFQLIWALISIILLFTVKHFVDILPHFLQCPNQSGDLSACMGPSAIIRMSFTLAVFHFLVFLFILSRGDAAAMFHDGCWLTKSLFVLGLFIGTMWIPNAFFQGYSDFARWVSAIFLIYQAILMLAVAYKINETLVGNYEQDQGSCSGAILLGLTIMFTVISITWLVFQYIWYGGCGYNNVIISVTVIAGIIFFVVVLLRTREDASILTSSIVLLYITYLQWSALASNPNETCNPFMYEYANQNTIGQICLGLFFTYLALIIISGSTKKVDENNLTAKVNQPLMENEEDNGEKVADVEKRGKTVDHEEMHVFPVSSATILFQALLILSAVYLSMLLTNWGYTTIYGQPIDYFEANSTSFWIKLITQWLSILIYLFSLIAPIIFPNRDY